MSVVRFAITAFPGGAGPVRVARLRWWLGWRT